MKRYKDPEKRIEQTKAAKKKYREKHRERLLADRALNRKKESAAQLARYYAQKEADPVALKTKHREASLRYMFKMSTEDYVRLLIEQNGVCAVCRRPPEPGTHLAVDHDRSCCPGRKACGRCVRGLLHVRCNSAIGMLRDDPLVLRNAADYLEKSR